MAQLHVYQTDYPGCVPIDGTISFSIDMAIDGELTDGVKVVAEGAAISDLMIGKDHKHQVAGTLVEKGEKDNYFLAKTPFGGDAKGPWETTITDSSIKLTAQHKLLLRVYVRGLDPLKLGTAKLKLTVTPLENPAGGCQQELQFDVITPPQFEFDGQRRNTLKTVAQQMLLGEDSFATRKLVDEEGWELMWKKWKIRKKDVDDEMERLLQSPTDVVPKHKS